MSEKKVESVERAPATEVWKYSPDPTIERIWVAREHLERAAGGDVRRLVALAAEAAARALAAVRSAHTPPEAG